MNYLVAFVVACLVLAAAQLLVVALGLALLLFVLVAAIKHPRQTLGVLVTLGLLGLASAQPTAFIVTAGVVIAVVLTGRTRKPFRALQLDRPQEELALDLGRFSIHQRSSPAFSDLNSTTRINRAFLSGVQSRLLLPFHFLWRVDL